MGPCTNYTGRDPARKLQPLVPLLFTGSDFAIWLPLLLAKDKLLFSANKVLREREMPEGRADEGMLAVEEEIGEGKEEAREGGSVSSARAQCIHK